MECGNGAINVPILQQLHVIIMYKTMLMTDYSSAVYWYWNIMQPVKRWNTPKNLCFYFDVFTVSIEDNMDHPLKDDQGAAPSVVEFSGGGEEVLLLPTYWVDLLGSKFVVNYQF